MLKTFDIRSRQPDASRSPMPLPLSPCPCRSAHAPAVHSYLPAPKADPDSPPAHVLCLFTGLTKVEMCTDWDGLQLRFPSISKGRAHKVDIKKTDLQTQARPLDAQIRLLLFVRQRP